MSFNIIDISTVPSKTWGDNCFAWTLLDSAGMTVLQEEMPPNTADEMHYHEHSEQFVYVLEDEVTIDVGEDRVILAKHQGSAYL